MVKVMKNSYHFLITISIGVLLIFLTGVGFADIPVHADPGLVGLSTTTSIDTQGITTTSTAVDLQLGSNTLNDPPLENGGILSEWWAGPDAPLIIGYTVDPIIVEFMGPAPPGELQYTTGYHEEMTAVSGNLSYQKTTSISTTNKTADENNIATDRLVTFTGGNGGRMTTSESILVDGTGAQTVSANQALCPFAGETEPFFPPFCNIVTSGSSGDLSSGSLSTSTNARFITTSVAVPVSENYLISAKGVTGLGGYTDAGGTISAFIKVHLQEGTEQEVPRWYNTDPLGFYPVKAEDLSYSETSTASGSFGGFTKSIQYQSGAGLI